MIKGEDKVNQVKTWSPSRYEKYRACPAKFKYEVIDKLCPLCFKGMLRGAWGEPQQCDACLKTPPEPDAFIKGNRLDAALEKFITDPKAVSLSPEVRNPKARQLAGSVKAAFKKKVAKLQLTIKLDRNWNPVKTQWGYWVQARLDVLLMKKLRWEVIDWKSGGIDKRTGAVWSETKYDDQLSLYATTVLSAYPVVEEVVSSLCFLEAGPAYNPIVSRIDGNLKREDLKAAQKKWEKKVTPMFNDQVFAPKPGACRYCPYQKGKGGPCAY
jgi:hypothetical protein